MLRPLLTNQSSWQLFSRTGTVIKVYYCASMLCGIIVIFIHWSFLNCIDRSPNVYCSKMPCIFPDNKEQKERGNLWESCDPLHHGGSSSEYFYMDYMWLLMLLHIVYIPVAGNTSWWSCWPHNWLSSYSEVLWRRPWGSRKVLHCCRARAHCGVEVSWAPCSTLWLCIISSIFSTTQEFVMSCSYFRRKSSKLKTQRSKSQPSIPISVPPCSVTSVLTNCNSKPTLIVLLG